MSTSCTQISTWSPGIPFLRVDWRELLGQFLQRHLEAPYKIIKNSDIYKNSFAIQVIRPVKQTFVNLTHISLASFLWDIGKQYRPRSDATEWVLRCRRMGHLIRVHCLLIVCSIKIGTKMKNAIKKPLKLKWVVQLTGVRNSIWSKWLKN